MKRTLVALAALVTITAAAQASEWHALNIGSFGFLFVDKESLVTDGHTAKVWAIESPRQTREAPYIYAQQLMVFDCAQKTYHIKQREIYKEDLVGLPDTRVPTQPQEPSPDSKEQWFMKFACNPNSGISTKIDGVRSVLRERAEARKMGRFDSN
jgi:hypothetical protein